MRTKVIVLSYNAIGDTLTCLESLRLQADSDSLDIMIVDNGSADGVVNAIRTHYPQFELVELSENRGWAGGNNAGIEIALSQGFDLICLLNNDTIIPPGAIAALASASLRYSPCLMHPVIDRAVQGEGPQLDPRLSRQSAKNALPGSWTPVDANEEIFELDFAYGACLMIPAIVFQRVGRFDERFFLQLEETDFYLRARQVGIPSLCTTKAQIIHAESSSFGGRFTPMKTYYTVRNTLLLAEKHHRGPLAAMRTIRSLYWTVSRVAPLGESGHSRVSFGSWLSSRNPFLVAARAGARDYVRRRFGAISQSTLAAILRRGHEKCFRQSKAGKEGQGHAGQ